MWRVSVSLLVETAKRFLAWALELTASGKPNPNPDSGPQPGPDVSLTPDHPFPAGSVED